MRRKVHGKNGEFAGDVCIGKGVLAQYAEVALAVAEDRDAEELVPRGGSDGGGSYEDGARAVGAGLSYEGIEEGEWGEGEEGFAVQLGSVGSGSRPNPAL